MSSEKIGWGYGSENQDEVKRSPGRPRLSSAQRSQNVTLSVRLTRAADEQLERLMIGAKLSRSEALAACINAGALLYEGKLVHIDGVKGGEK